MQKLKNQSEITIPAEAERKAAEITAEGESKSVEIVEIAKNELLQQKVELLSQAGDIGKVALFFTKLPTLFDSYTENAKELKVDNLLVFPMIKCSNWRNSSSVPFLNLTSIPNELKYLLIC